MLNVRHIPTVVVRTPPVPQQVRFERSLLIASPELQAQRLAVCAACQFNESGICRQCCGGTPVTVLVQLNVSRCVKKYW